MPPFASCSFSQLSGLPHRTSQVQLWQLGRLMPGSLRRHLEACGVLPVLFGASWLMTAFSSDFPASFSARILDVVISDKCGAMFISLFMVS